MCLFRFIPSSDVLNVATFVVALSLESNQLSGSIPTQFGNLQRLKNFTVGNNNITGNVPPEVCGLNDLAIFETDCQKVTCTCCTVCAPTATPTVEALTPAPSQGVSPAPSGSPSGTEPPTLTPTKLATEPPTSIPTAKPTICTDFIKWVPKCIDIGEDVVVEFQNCDPQFGDWIGIFSKDADPSNLPEAALWVWACGSQSCRGSPQTNTVTLNEDDADTQSAQDGTAWPLRPDDYIAYLIRNVGPPYTAVLSSDKMKIRENAC